MALILDGSLGVPVTTVTGTLPVANGGTGVATSTGSGANALATSPTLTTPVLSGSVTGTYTLAGTPTITSPTITGASISTMASSVITSGTAVATTSGTSIDFTGIPSWVKRVTLMFNGVSLNGTTAQRIQLGSGSVQTTGYTGNKNYTSNGVGNGSATAGFEIIDSGDSATLIITGHVTFTLISGAIWICSGVTGHTGAAQPTAYSTSGTVTLSGALDRIRLTTANGTATYDAGSVNIFYE